MTERTIHLSRLDHDRLKTLIDDVLRSETRDVEHVVALANEMRRAVVLPPGEIPGDVITMRSRARLVDLDTHEVFEYTLVFPQEAEITTGKISVLAPVGTAMLGYRIGDEFEWEVPTGVRRLRVDALPYQPEAAGDYHL
ncbi:MAG: nucleoside diphosphate kinase regulator [Thermoanaerobaculaceae bacterium]|nr:nucleoside diphosphate kinase regulator [Thermoanaerobaculaceae bacterium]MDI9622663.1 nucleoside diphosphate kinase regulator [Acidobacteriota bacterium]NLH10335.1 nucleoside diphosphate kinase regulator [Holophagae bacterium]HPW54588.1 nucleoside diphosphate kinase regulator [Thermoanaerobaculaceae bacterium]